MIVIYLFGYSSVIKIFCAKLRFQGTKSFKEMTVGQWWKKMIFSNCIYPCRVRMLSLSVQMSCANDTSNFPNLFLKIWNSNFHCYIWIQHEKCIQMSTNKPSIGSVFLEISPWILRQFCQLCDQHVMLYVLEYNLPWLPSFHLFDDARSWGQVCNHVNRDFVAILWGALKLYLKFTRHVDTYIKQFKLKEHAASHFLKWGIFLSLFILNNLSIFPF